MRGRALPLVFVLLFSAAAQAQITWQPAQPPLVTADNEAWYRSGQAIEWNGEFYYPAGAAEAFNRYQMVRSGSYRGIPLYTDATLEPYSIVFVPISGGRLQPYERPRTGMLAGSVGSRPSAFPTSPATEDPAALGLTTEGFVAQAPAPPTFARAYDLGQAPVAAETSHAPAPIPAPAATSGRTMPRATGTSGRVAPVTISTAARPTGINGVWLDFDGRRWVYAGKAVDLTPEFTKVGDYRGFPVYQRRGDSLTIYVPSAGDLVVPFKPRGLCSGSGKPHSHEVPGARARSIAAPFRVPGPRVPGLQQHRSGCRVCGCQVYSSTVPGVRSRGAMSTDAPLRATPTSAITAGHDAWDLAF